MIPVDRYPPRLTLQISACQENYLCLVSSLCLGHTFLRKKNRAYNRSRKIVFVSVSLLPQRNKRRGTYKHGRRKNSCNATQTPASGSLVLAWLCVSVCVLLGRVLHSGHTCTAPLSREKHPPKTRSVVPRRFVHFMHRLDIGRRGGAGLLEISLMMAIVLESLCM